jgi:hypothetical protein
MSPSGKYFIFSGNAVGAAAQFHKLDQLQNLNHVIPTLGASALPGTGGLSKGHAANYCYAVDQPRKRTLLAVRRIDTKAEGLTLADRWETDVEAEIEAVDVLEKLEIGLVKLHFNSSRKMDSENCEATISTRGSRIEGLRMGSVEAKIILDEEPLQYTSSKENLADYYRKQNSGWRSANARRFGTLPDAAAVREVNGTVKFSLVREIQLIGKQDPEHEVRVQPDGYTIKWDGFGRIILGEVFVKCCDRRVTMVRLHMGSDGGGSGSVGDGSSNGQTGTN